MNTNEMKRLVEDALKNINAPPVQETGLVLSVYDGICKVTDLHSVTMGELVFFEESNIRGVVIELEVNFVCVLVIGDYTKISAGQIVVRLKELFTIKVNNFMNGRILNGYGDAIDGLSEITGTSKLVEQESPKLTERKGVFRQMSTGIKIIDWLFPIGYGQRQLIVGGRSTGKTSIILNTILTQNKPNVMNIYVAIGQKPSSVVNLINSLKEANVSNYIIIVASASDPASMLYFAPFVGTAIGEYFRDLGQDAIVYFDDLSSHAIAYREISLILKRPPGREAYSGDIFYLHSRLLERAAQTKNGSLTAIPVVSAQDISQYTATNVISISDGQIFTDNEVTINPAIHIGKSVSRIGSDVLTKLMKRYCGSMKLEIARLSEQEAQLISSDKSDDKSDRMFFLKAILNQKIKEVWPLWKQILLLYAVENKYISNLAEYNQFKKYSSLFEKFEQDILMDNESVVKDILKSIGSFNE